MTLYEYIQQLQDFCIKNPQWVNLPVAYAEDDEGNGFQLVGETEPTPIQVEDNTQYHLELVGYYADNSDDIDKQDVNCILIN